MYAKVEETPVNWRHLKVFVDGEEMELCTEANEEEGWALGFDSDESGKTYRDGDDVARRTLRGKVEIFVKEAGEYYPAMMIGNTAVRKSLRDARNHRKVQPETR